MIPTGRQGPLKKRWSYGRICLFPAVVAVCGLSSPLHAAQFVVEDAKAPEEISEAARIYIDGKLEATFELNDRVTQKRVMIRTPGDSHDHGYALCGDITIRTPDGRTETHEVSSEGVLHNPDGHVFQAMGADRFTDFFLVDPNAPETAEHRRSHPQICASVTS